MKTVDEHIPFGVYIWVLPDGRDFSDGEGNVLSIFALRGDREKVKTLANTAKLYMKEMGMEPGGKPRFVEGARKISEHEWREQQDRMRAGLVPDPYDIGSLMDDERNRRFK